MGIDDVNFHYLRIMPQEDKWLEKNKEVRNFIEINHRSPSKHRIEEHLMLIWIKHNRKLLNASAFKTKCCVLILVDSFVLLILTWFTLYFSYSYTGYQFMTLFLFQFTH